MQVLDKGDITLMDFMGGDKSVVGSARVSNGILPERASKGEIADGKLIHYLMKHKHGSPFEHSYFTFYVKAPLFVIREWQRHRMASYNEVSGRYVEFGDQVTADFYVPDQIRVPGTSNKQGSMVPGLEWFDEQPYAWIGGKPNNWNEEVRKYIIETSERSLERYKKLIHTYMVAKELARMVLPLNIYSEFWFTVNARSLMNFLSLRNSSFAQWEIREYAKALEGIFSEKMPSTYSAFVINQRVAP
jgi:thymidylate synthase (FAD)